MAMTAGKTCHGLWAGRFLAAGALAWLVLTLFAAVATAQGPGLPRTYQPTIIDTPNPLGGGSFGWGISSADLTGDGKLDLLVAQAQTGKGQIFIFDGVSGRHIDTIDPPEQNPPVGGNPANNETLGFVYVETMADVGSCPGGDGPDAGEICDLSTIGAGDSIPEIIVGARNLKVDPTNGAQAPDASDPNIGRGYVFDGATRAVLKRIDMPVADRQEQAVLLNPNAQNPAGTAAAPQFGRVMMTPSGLPPCRGLRSENNNFGVTPCPELPAPERIGDVNGGGQPDIVITARNYRERAGTQAPTPSGQAAQGSPCRNATTGTCGSGKAWVYPGEQIAGTSPQAILETPLYELKNPRSATTGGGEYGGNMFRVGDTNGDSRPDFVIPARTLSYPLNDPDPAAFPNVGASFHFNGATGALLRTNPHPEPEPRSQFSGNFNSGRPTGDLGATQTSDYLQPAALQNVTTSDDGRVYVFNGDLAAGGGAEQSWNFATLDDPTPIQGGNFGGSTTGVGDLVSGARAPTNEVLIGGFHFDTFTETSNNTPADLHFMNATTERNLQTVPHPLQERGDGFGVGLIPMGDLNDDGFLDFAASSYLANVGETAAAGRAYIMRSDNSPQRPLPTTPGGRTSASTPTVFKAGACANDFLGTDRSETLNGSDAGDRMAGFGGNDVIRGFHDDDCLHGGSGRDRLAGGPDQDRLLGSSGNDRLNGGTDRDTLFGQSGRDRLVGAFGRDRLYGGSGNDRLSGGGHGDRLFGERGNDRIHAGGGADGSNNVDAGPGNDVVNVLNGKRDRVRCGRGTDRVVADRRDRLNGCERVSRRRVR